MPKKQQKAPAPSGTASQLMVLVRRIPLTTWRLVGAGVVAVALLASAGLIWHSRQDRGKQDLASVEASVGRLMVLPQGETPTLATITNRDQLQKNSFLYTKGQNGDKVLVYAKAGRAIIYRPSLRKIIDIGPVVVDESHADAKGATILIQDSTNRPEVAQKVLQKVQTAYPEARVSVGGATNRQQFPGTIVIDNTGQKDNFVEGLDSLLGTQRGVLPLTETKPSANILIIIGQDYQ